MTFINRKIRIFRNIPDTEIHPQRSEGRMKTYQSATDARSWCNSIEDRRQHILDLIRGKNEKGPSRKKYVLTGAVTDILLANKSDSIKRLQRKIEELKKLNKDQAMNYISRGTSRMHNEQLVGDGFNENLLRTKSTKPRYSKYNLDGDSLSTENSRDSKKNTKLTQTNLLKESRDSYPFKFFDRNKSKLDKECNELKSKLSELENKKQLLAKKVQHCECHMTNQMKKIKRLARHIDHLMRSQHNRLQKRRSLTSAAVKSSPQQIRPKSLLTETHEKLALETQSQLMQSSYNIVDSRNDSTIERYTMQKTDIGDSIATKLDLEKQKCNEIVNRYTDTVTNIKLDIDIIKRAKCNYCTRKRRYLNSAHKDVSDEDIFCSCRHSSENTESRRND